ncbi:MAG: hypothetical protein RLZZ293_505, partial [Pseudomonadota bacterium]|jgi:glutamate--cysteine ligase
MDFLQLVKQHNLTSLLCDGNFGLEKENIRTDLNGNLSLTPHPEVFGDKAKHPYITTDFAEAQVEMVTPIFATSQQALNFMEALHDLVSLELKNELLWPYSLPPKLPIEDNLIREAQFANPEITEYREYLAAKYGKRKQLLSGVHFNFSFADSFLQQLYCANPNGLSFREFKDQVYLKVARYYLKFCWLVIYLTGANSVAHATYLSQEHAQRKKTKLTEDSYYFDGASSFRNGVSGYRNLDYFYVSYNSLYDYIADIKQAISSGHIIAAKEYYSQLRLKGHTKSGVLDDLYNNGINYVEIRTLDLNPLTKVGITPESLELIHLILIYGLLAPDFLMSDEEYRLANQNQILAADSNRSQEIWLHYSTTEAKHLQNRGIEVLQQIYTTLSEAGISQNKLAVLDYYQQRLQDNQPSYACEIAKQVAENGYSDYFINLATKYFDLSKRHNYQFCGFEDLELSTQILLKEAVKWGLKFKFLDRQDNFISLTQGKLTQYIKQATKTSLDNYATILAMENKLVTKQLLTDNGLIVANGENYTQLTDALANYSRYQQGKIVIKPNSTNFGQGITIFKQACSYSDFNYALNYAFSFDQQILIEQLAEGQEYRFFVIDGQCLAVLYREPANVIGDGKSTISQLVTLKNLDPLRGTGYVTPLEKITLGETEALFLAEQGLDFNSIPEFKHKIYLRENSNISTGGDSLDVTELMPKAYKRIAVKAANSCQARICGVDMLIRDISNPYPENNYTLIELNFNPAIHIHTYPYQGKNRKLAKKILDALGFNSL